ncbi:2-dehydropantoate 2-reductase [Amniculicola lignicola CBS 123094]|uniref:2-dehydropantoate 2-reductase n=1 Tax=Amniculicola lignicola CBS 123094 TaxID=1392246 RepID=A0A6A5WK04_9PLEO|nr:2-dehydropantoate 2-reductase [Amniculicola lignicola CBS 123094]
MAEGPKVLLFGAGSVGAVYLYLLSKVSSTTAVCRSNYGIVKKDGFTINSSIFGKDIRFIPNVVRDCDEAKSLDTKPFDYIVICSKATPGTTPQIIAPAVTPGHTIIVLIQNGIGIEDEYTSAFPTNPLVSCVVYLPATQRPAGIIKHGEVERLEIGIYPSSAPAAPAKVFGQLITAAGATVEVHDDVQIKRWSKLLVNAAWNPICALTLCTDVNFMLSSEPATDLIFAIMLEVRDIAAAYGHDIPREEVEYQLGRAKDRIHNGVGVEPSMLQDVRGARRMEVEVIVGNVVRLGKKAHVKCERLEMLYLLAKALDSQLGRKNG